MKFFKISILVISIIAINSLTFKRQSVQGESEEQKLANEKANYNFQNDMAKLWEDIFKDTDRKACKVANIKGKVGETKSLEIGGIRANVPLKRDNYYEKLNIGFGGSAYLFDYLDEILREPVVNNFRDVVKNIGKFPKEIKGCKEDSCEDPYTLNKMLSIPLENSPSQDDLIQKLTRVYPSFNKDYWEKSFNAVQLRQAFTENKWYIPPGVSDPAKRLIDKFDFNGDGRLSDYEVIVAIIDANKSIYGQNKCKNCFEEVYSNFLDPIFSFSNLDNDDKISAEEMWRSFEYLKRKTNKYNIYLCRVDGQGVRTNSINDFIIKNQKVYKGSLNKKEFALGILIGYWGRQVDRSAIFMKSEKSKREDRWSDPDAVDNNCISS